MHSFANNRFSGAICQALPWVHQEGISSCILTAEIFFWAMFFLEVYIYIYIHVVSRGRINRFATLNGCECTVEISQCTEMICFYNKIQRTSATVLWFCITVFDFGQYINPRLLARQRWFEWPWRWGLSDMMLTRHDKATSCRVFSCNWWDWCGMPGKSPRLKVLPAPRLFNT